MRKREAEEAVIDSARTKEEAEDAYATANTDFNIA